MLTIFKQLLGSSQDKKADHLGTLNELPKDILFIIMSDLEMPDLLSLMATSKGFRATVEAFLTSPIFKREGLAKTKVEKKAFLADLLETYAEYKRREYIYHQAHTEYTQKYQVFLRDQEQQEINSREEQALWRTHQEIMIDRIEHRRKDRRYDIKYAEKPDPAIRNEARAALKEPFTRLIAMGYKPSSSEQHLYRNLKLEAVKKGLEKKYPHLKVHHILHPSRHWYTHSKIERITQPSFPPKPDLAQKEWKKFPNEWEKIWDAASSPAEKVKALFKSYYKPMFLESIRSKQHYVREANEIVNAKTLHPNMSAEEVKEWIENYFYQLNAPFVSGFGNRFRFAIEQLENKAELNSTNAVLIPRK